tara:strand:- start:4542 stop:5177 length:636 start_codon:yes stop_codon:yes gene_type:complete
MSFLKEVFPEIPQNQQDLLSQYCDLIKEWNPKVNLVSRKDIDGLEQRHLLPSLAITKVASFSAGAKVLDVGTGGGFPGIPLAICFPQTQFMLIDSIGKKIGVVQDVVERLGLENVRTAQVRAESLEESFDYVVGRAVTALPAFLGWIHNKLKVGKKGSLENGVLYLKGGDLTEELAQLKMKPEAIYSLEDYFPGGLCEGKCLVYFKAQDLA